MCFTFTDSLIVERLNSLLPFENFTQSNPTWKKPFFITLFPPFCIYFLCSSVPRIFKNRRVLHQLIFFKSPLFTKYTKNSLQFLSKPSKIRNLSFSIISSKNTIPSSSQRFESFHFIRLSHELLKKNLFSSIHSQKYKYTPKPLPSILIHSKNSWRRRKRQRKLRESSWPQSTDPLSNRERRWDKLISIQSVVSTDVEPTLPPPPQWAQSPSRPTRSR